MNIFVTGGSRGIGLNIVKTALSHGYNVAFTYRDPATTDAQKLLSELQTLAPSALCKAYLLDVRFSDQVSTVVDAASDDFGDFDAVVNNAGININNLAFSMTDSDWQDVIDTNLTGAFYIIRQFLPIFLANRKGRFISISSIASRGMSGQANYSASKAGLLGLSAAISKEYGQKGITSNVISPGFFKTEMTDNTMSEQLKAFWMQHCPAGRMGQLEELSELVMFLASDKASFINGQNIYVTGGLDWAG